MNKIRSLVTGGAGFIGSHVAIHCLKMGHDTFVVDDLSGGFTDQVPKGAYFIKGDVTNYKFIEDLFNKFHFDYIFHLAAYAAEGLSHFIRRFNYKNNVIGSINLINQAIKKECKCFVFTSSIAVYGAGQLPMQEDLAPKPEDPYGVAKYAVELDLQAAREMFGLNYIIFRPHNVYGEHQNIGDRYRNVIGIFMNQVMQGKPMTIFGDGTQTRAFSYIDDVAPYIAASVEKPEAYNSVINIGADTPISVRNLAEIVASAFDITPIIEFYPARKEVLHAYSDHEKAKMIFGCEKFVSIEDGIASMAAWAKKVGHRASKRFSKLEIKHKLPSIWKARTS